MGLTRAEGLYDMAEFTTLLSDLVLVESPRWHDDRLLVVAGDQLLVSGADGTLSPYAELGALSTKPWNDIVSDGRGNTYVNNIGFDFPDGEFAPGLIALVEPDGTARQVADGLA